MIKLPKTINGLCSMLAKVEGKKSQVKIGDVREIVGILSDITFTSDAQEYADLQALLLDNGAKRAKKKKKK